MKKIIQTSDSLRLSLYDIQCVIHDVLISEKEKDLNLSKCGRLHHVATGKPVIQLLKLFTKFYNLEKFIS